METIAAVSAAMLFSAGCLFAQQKYVYQVEVSDKTINIDGLGLPGSTPLVDVLSLMPELLLNADHTGYATQYDILIDGISESYASNSVLSQTHLSDLKSITISESPAASQQKNGYGGVIKLELNEISEGFSGRASADAASSGSNFETVKLNYRKGKLKVRSWLSFDADLPGYSNEYRTLETGHGTIYCIDTTWTRGLSQAGRIFADYAPSSRDVFKFRFYESSRRVDNLKYMQMVTTGESDAGGRNQSKSATVAAILNYSHKFDRGKLDAEAEYCYLPAYGRDERRNPLKIDGQPSRTSESLNIGHVWEGAVKWELPVAVSEDRDILVFKTGVNMTSKSSRNEYSEKANFALLSMPASLDGDVVTRLPGNSLYLSPFIELRGGGKKLEYQASARYQHYESSSNLEGADAPVTSFRNDVTCNLNLAWQMTPHQHLRLVMDHGIIRPSDWQMNPEMVYRPDMESYVVGNANLVPSKLNSVSLNYVTDIKKKSSYILLNGSLGMIHTEGLINPVHEIRDAGMLLPYQSYENAGSSNILKADLLCVYNRGPLMLTFAANVFDKFQEVSESRDYRLHYNCSFGALCRITPLWTVSGELAYNSRIFRPTVNHGPSLNGDLRLSKTWDRLEAYAVVNGILHKARWEVDKDTMMTSYRYYDLYASSVVVGFSYLF